MVVDLLPYLSDILFCYDSVRNNGWLSRHLPPGRGRRRCVSVRVQKITLTLLFIAGIVNFLDRSSLSVAGEAIRADLGLQRHRVWGAALRLFALLRLRTIAVGNIAGSRWTAHCARRRTDFLVRNAGPDRDGQFVLAFYSAAHWPRIGEAPFMPAGVKSINDWYAQRERRYGGGDI